MSYGEMKSISYFTVQIDVNTKLVCRVHVKL